MKNVINTSIWFIPFLKLDLKMKLSLLFILTSLCSMQAFDVHGQDKISLDIESGTVEDFIIEIENTTDYSFIYKLKDVDIKRKVSVKAENEDLSKVLEKVFENTKTTYNILEKRIFLIASNKKSDKKFGSNIQFQENLKGTVVDESGLPIPGVNVIEKGTSNGTVTDIDGSFEISVSNQDAVLSFSYVGFIIQDIKVGNQTKFDIVLQTDEAKLDEVVVVGYGKLSRENVTGAVSSVKSKDIQEFPSTSVEQSLIGKLPGVQFSQNSGQPGAGISVRVRGLASISGGNEPLYVIDGVPFFSNNVRFQNGLSSINPNDIESIEVLKDASSTAIYGSRGSNGVILVTTKSGTKGTKPTISYNSWVSVRDLREKIDVMNGSEFLEFQENFFANSDLDLPEEIAGIQNFNTDWQDEVFRTAVATNHDLSFTGGNNKSSYYLALNYLSEEGIVLNSDFQRLSFRANLNSDINETFSIKSSFTFSNSEQNGFREAENNNTNSFLASGIGRTLQALPTEPVFNEDGTYADVSPYDFSQILANPVLYANDVLDKVTVRRLIGSFTLESTIFEDLVNYTRVGLDYGNSRNDFYIPTTIINSIGDASVSTSENFNYVFENYLEYNNEIFPELDFKAVVGGSLQEEKTKNIFLSSSGFFTDNLSNNAIQAGQTTAVPVTINIDQSIASAFGRVNFNYKNRYLLEASLRSDGASVFSENNKLATFPAVSAGWKLIEEDFLSNNSSISNLKLRASWGKTGNQGIQPYQSLPLGIIVTGSQGAGSGLSTGLAPNLPNENLTWETTTQTNIGLDFGLLENRFNLSFDYYIKDTQDALTEVQLQPSSGFATIIDNVGAIENKGIELALSGLIIDKKDLSFSLDFNFSQNENEVTALNDGEDIISEFTFAQVADAVGGVSSVARVGQPIGAFLGFKFTGFDENGEPQYDDINNDGSLTDDDKVVIGNPIPKILYGFNTNLRYKNFSFRTNWQGVADVDILNLSRFNLTAPDNSFNRSNDIYNFYPNVSQSTIHRMSDRYIEKGSYLRLRNIEIGYNVPLSNNLFLNSLSFYVSGQNLITITDYTGFDPDVNSLSGNSINQGVDLGAYPANKSFTLGLTAKF